MMLSLILHSAHQQKPEQILIFVVAASDDLMVDKWSSRFLSESYFFFMVADEDEGRVEPSKEFSDDPVDDVGPENVEADVVAYDKRDVELNDTKCT